MESRQLKIVLYPQRATVFLASMIIMLAALEIVLRLTKEPPWQPDLVPFRVESGGKLYEHDSQLGYRIKPGRYMVFMADGFSLETTHWSILPTSIEKRWTKIKAYAVSVVEISRQIIQTTAREAGQAGAWFLRAGIENDSRTRAMLQWWRTQVGQEEDLSVELDRPGMTNHPHDAHPGPRAHRIYAEKLIPVLREKS